MVSYFIKAPIYIAFFKTFILLYLTQVYSRFLCVFLSNFEWVQKLKITLHSFSFVIVKSFSENVHQHNNFCLF